jgi:hypothetical protein
MQCLLLPTQPSNKSISQLLYKQQDLELVSRNFEKVPAHIKTLDAKDLTPIPYKVLLDTLAKIITETSIKLDISDGYCNRRTDSTNLLFHKYKISSLKGWLVGGFTFKTPSNRRVHFGVHVVSIVLIESDPVNQLYVVDLAYSKEPILLLDYVEEIRSNQKRKCLILDYPHRRELRDTNPDWATIRMYQ